MARVEDVAERMGRELTGSMTETGMEADFLSTPYWVASRGGAEEGHAEAGAVLVSLQCGGGEQTLVVAEGRLDNRRVHV